jgi:hypothetical protein
MAARGTSANDARIALASRDPEEDDADTKAVDDALDHVGILGKSFYGAVNENPVMALMGAECEEACYLPAHVHAKRFDGNFPEHDSGISRESNSNRAGWPDL